MLFNSIKDGDIENIKLLITNQDKLAEFKTSIRQLLDLNIIDDVVVI